MQRKLWILAVTVIIALGLLAGCSDDSSTSPTTYAGFVTGSIYLEPGAYISDILIHGIGAVPPHIDSVRVGDSLLVGDDFINYNYDEEYHDAYWEIYFDESGTAETYMYSHGDTAQISFYGPGGTATTSLVVLDADDAEVYITTPVSSADTIANGDSETVYWNKVDHVDYYAILLEFRELIGGSSNWHYRFDYTTDTSYTVTSAMYTDSLNYFYVNVVPFNGPNPATGASNVSGTWLTGKIYSFGWYDYVQVYGFHGPGLSKAVVESKPIEWNPQQVIEEVYKRTQ